MGEIMGPFDERIETLLTPDQYEAYKEEYERGFGGFGGRGGRGGRGGN
jgi:hypothetical protein